MSMQCCSPPRVCSVCHNGVVQQALLTRPGQCRSIFAVDGARTCVWRCASAADICGISHCSGCRRESKSNAKSHACCTWSGNRVRTCRTAPPGRDCSGTAAWALCTAERSRRKPDVVMSHSHIMRPHEAMPPRAPGRARRLLTNSYRNFDLPQHERLSVQNVLLEPRCVVEHRHYCMRSHRHHI